MPPPQGQSGFSGKSGYSGFSGAGGGQSGYSGYSGRVGATGLQGPTGPQGVAGPQGQTGSAGPSGLQGLSGFSGYSGAAGMTGPNIAIPGSVTTGVGSGNAGGIDLSGSTSGKARLTVKPVAGTGTFELPSTSGTHTLATQADLTALRTELLGLING